MANKLVCSSKQFGLRSLLKIYIGRGEFVQQSEEQCLGKDIYYLHFRKLLPHSILLSKLRPFHLTASSVAIDAIPFLHESSLTLSCSIPVYCNSYQELASGSLPTGCASLSYRPASVQATQSSVQ
jgi:hypothetical protein